MVALVSIASSRGSIPVSPVKAYRVLHRYVRESLSLQRERQELDEALDTIYHYISNGSPLLEGKPTDGQTAPPGN